MSIDKSAFEFNTESDIFSKITGRTESSKNLQNKSAIWNYKNIIEEEENLKSQRKGKDFKPVKGNLQSSNTITSNDNNTFVIDEDTKDKYESELYSKIMSFSDFNLSKYLIKSCADLEYYYPTKVQEKVIPMILKGKNDVII